MRTTVHPIIVVLVLAILTVCTLTVFGQAIVIAPLSYADAHKESHEQNKPLLILIGTDWCPGCVVMKDQTIPAMQAKGMLKDVAYAHVDADKEYDLAVKLLDGTSIPQLLIYYKVNNVWKHKNLIGPKSEREIREFLK
jgi:thiol-disulfide isomerase/thioredoxin